MSNIALPTNLNKGVQNPDDNRFRLLALIYNNMMSILIQKMHLNKVCKPKKYNRKGMYCFVRDYTMRGE